MCSSTAHGFPFSFFVDRCTTTKRELPDLMQSVSVFLLARALRPMTKNLVEEFNGKKTGRFFSRTKILFKNITFDKKEKEKKNLFAYCVCVYCNTLNL